jgi:ribulose kinase
MEPTKELVREHIRASRIFAREFRRRFPEDAAALTKICNGCKQPWESEQAQMWLDEFFESLGEKDAAALGKILAASTQWMESNKAKIAEREKRRAQGAVIHKKIHEGHEILRSISAKLESLESRLAGLDNALRTIIERR